MDRGQKPGAHQHLKSCQEKGSLVVSMLTRHRKQEHQWGYTKGGQKEHLDTLLSFPDVQTLGSVLVPVNSTFLIPGNVSIPQLISGAVSKINP